MSTFRATVVSFTSLQFLQHRQSLLAIRRNARLHGPKHAFLHVLGYDLHPLGGETACRALLGCDVLPTQTPELEAFAVDIGALLDTLREGPADLIVYLKCCRCVFESNFLACQDGGEDEAILRVRCTITSISIFFKK